MNGKLNLQLFAEPTPEQNLTAKRRTLVLKTLYTMESKIKKTGKKVSHMRQKYN